MIGSLGYRIQNNGIKSKLSCSGGEKKADANKRIVANTDKQKSASLKRVKSFSFLHLLQVYNYTYNSCPPTVSISFTIWPITHGN